MADKEIGGKGSRSIGVYAAFFRDNHGKWQLDAGFAARYQAATGIRGNQDILAFALVPRSAREAALAAIEGAVAPFETVDDYLDGICFADIPEDYAGVETDIAAAAASALLNTVKLELAPLEVLLLPADEISSEVFARVAMREKLGMTAEVSNLYRTADGSVLADKPSNVAREVVTCMTQGSESGPALITMRTTENANHIVVVEERLHLRRVIYANSSPTSKKSGVRAVSRQTSEKSEDKLGQARHVVAVGRGLMDEEGLNLAKQYAEKTGSALGASRPVIDQGFLPYAQQIGQSGTYIAPDTCLAFGVSGAVQFTDGIHRGSSSVFIAVNKDPEAGIFQVADYGVVADGKTILRELLKR